VVFTITLKVDIKVSIKFGVYSFIDECLRLWH